ncbi:hypothetical protein H6F89_30120 [Cyanobacteria bacterium FACHB-63]|nr:hypothetical protein [Cyanobacteria bacterium FACHB-63]
MELPRDFYGTLYGTSIYSGRKPVFGMAGSRSRITQLTVRNFKEITLWFLKWLLADS